MAEENQTVEIKDTETVQNTTEVAAPTRDALKESGWSRAELDAAEKRGMIQKPEKKKEEEKTEEVTKAPEEPAKAVEEKRVEDRRKNSLPEFTFKTPEQEKAWLEAFGPGTEQRAMYFRMKNERQSRQAAEAERDRIKLETQLLKDRIAALETGRTQQPEVDENGNVIDPDDKPLTARQLKEMQEKEDAERRKAEEERYQRALRTNESLKNQEEYARSLYEDFDDTAKLAADLMQNMESLVPEKWKQAKAVKLIKDLQITAAEADKQGIDDYNAALIAYELGQLHPSYGKKANGTKAETDNDGNSKDPHNANGSVTPEQMKRIAKNTQRGASSASIPGSNGSRTVSVDEITAKDVLKMTPEQRRNFKAKYPEKMDKLLRG